MSTSWVDYAMTTKFTYYSKQQLLEIDGLVYKMVWTIDGYDSYYDDYEFGYRYALTPSPTIEYRWNPPHGLATGTIKTRGLKPAIDLGFLVLVAPVKR